MERKKCVVLVGPPGSGKSTMADKEYPDYTLVSQDSQGSDHKNIFERAISDGDNVVVDRMNFDREQRGRWLIPARNAGYETHIVVLQVSRSKCVSRCGLRKNHPTIRDTETAHLACDTFFGKYQKPLSDEANSVVFHGHKSNFDHCVVIDLDGTLCNIDHRLHWVKNKEKKDNRWDKFFKEIPNDKVNPWCGSLVRSMMITHPVIFASGRPFDYRNETADWLNQHGFGNHDGLFMRTKSDFRQDYIVKEIILDFEILTRYNPLFFVDDRKQVVDMWRRRGFVCLQCDEGNF